MGTVSFPSLYVIPPARWLLGALREKSLIAERKVQLAELFVILLKRNEVRGRDLLRIIEEKFFNFFKTKLVSSTQQLILLTLFIIRPISSDQTDFVRDSNKMFYR